MCLNLFCSYLRKPTGQEFFIPAQTLNWGKAVKSIDGLNSCSLVCIASLYLVGCSQQQWMTWRAQILLNTEVDKYLNLMNLLKSFDIVLGTLQRKGLPPLRWRGFIKSTHPEGGGVGSSTTMVIVFVVCLCCVLWSHLVVVSHRMKTTTTLLCVPQWLGQFRWWYEAMSTAIMVC